MAKHNAGQLTRCLRDMVDSHACDRELLDRFLTHHDEQAFETLVRRHDRLVRSAIGKVIGNSAAAEDVYQAAFLVLVRRCRTVDWRAGLGPWLYGVAHRVAVKARTRDARLARLESAARPGQPILPADLSWIEACDLLHAELDRLPDRYRMPLLLCYLEGKTREEAAAALGISIGTVKGRVRRGCDLLRDRLSRRGVALSAGLLAVLAAPVAESAMTAPAAMVAAIRGAASGRVKELAQEIIMGSIMSKLAKVSVVALLSTGLVAAVVAATGLAAPTNPSQSPAAARKEGDPPARDKTGARAEPLPGGARVRLGTLDWRHGGGVGFVAFTPDGKAVLTGGGEWIRLWDRETGKEIRRFAGPPVAENAPPGPMTVALSNDGKLLAAAYEKRGVVVWETESGKELQHIPGNLAGILQFTPDGEILAFRTWNRSTFLFETATGKEIGIINGQKQGAGGPIGFNPASAGMAISPDGKTLATAETGFFQGGVNSWVSLTDLKSGKVIQEIEEKESPSAVAYSPDGKLLAYATGQWILLCDAKTAKEIRKIKTPIHVFGLAFAPDSKSIGARAGDLFIRVWETDTGKEMRVFGDGVRGDISRFQQPSITQSFAFSPDSKFVVAAAGNSVRMWEIASGKEVALAGGHRDSITALAVAPDGKTVVSRGGDKLIRWEVATGKPLGAFPVSMGTADADLSQDGRMLALNIGDTIQLVDVATGKVLLRQVPEPGKFAGTVAFSPNGKVLASRGLHHIRLHDTQGGPPLKQIPLPAAKDPGPRDGLSRPPRLDPLALAFSPDGQTLAAPVADTLRVWDVTTGKEIGKFQLPQPVTGCMTFAPDGRVLAIENADLTISLWETATGKERGRLGQAQAADADRSILPTRTLAFSPDGGLLATKAGHAIAIWDVAAAKEIARFKGHEADITALAFFPGGKALVSGSEDTTSLVWETADLKRAPAPPAADLQPKQLEFLWADLADEDAARAFRSILTLASASKQTVPYLRDRLQPAAPVDAKVIKNLIADLDSGNFQTRSKASKELEGLGEVTVPALREALAGKVPLETRQRMEPILAKLTGSVLSTEQVRLVRAVEVLERLATPEARQALQSLAEGAPGSLPTRHARAALDRLAR
jgi:RNA polymerase sigma factor (sigma-70 family)